MKKLFLPLALVLPAVLLLWTLAGGGSMARPSADLTPLCIAGQNPKGTKFFVELAEDNETRVRGLMFREHMDENRGMLFVFPDAAPRSFWMQNTLIPLDMVFINADGTIRHIHKRARPHDLSAHPSNGPVKYVLEINGGIADKYGIKTGNVVHHKIIGNDLPDGICQ